MWRPYPASTKCGTMPAATRANNYSASAVKEQSRESSVEYTHEGKTHEIVVPSQLAPMLYASIDSCYQNGSCDASHDEGRSNKHRPSIVRGR
jgi:hypothetical protein